MCKKLLLFLFPRTNHDSLTISNKSHTPRDGISAKRWDEKIDRAQWSKLPPSSTTKWDIPWDIIMASKLSDIANRRLTNLTFTSAEYLRSSPQNGNSLEGWYRGTSFTGHRHTTICHTCAAWHIVSTYDEERK